MSTTKKKVTTVGVWFSSRLYYPFGKGPGQHIIRCLENKKCENERYLVSQIQGLHSTQVRHHTQSDLLTFRVCFVQRMMISTQVRHHTQIDLSTCPLLCWTYDDHASVLPPTLVWSLPIVCMWSRSLSFFSALVGDLLPRRLFDGFCQRCITRRWWWLLLVYQSKIWRAMLERTQGLFDAFPTSVGGHHWSLGTTFLGS